MSPVLGRVIKEPLLHFLLIGLLLFGLFAALNKDSTGPANRIAITRADVEQLQALFQRQWQRPPTPQELQALIEGRIREEVLYREALALGLDRDDTIVRRRMAQKVEFLVADTAVPSQPGEAVLTAYLKENPERYREPARMSFTHVYFSRDKRAARAESDAEAVLKRLQATKGNTRNAPALGDRFMLAYDYANRGTDEVAREFGQAFADEVARFPVGKWSGPVASGYGIHLVYVSAREEAKVPPFEKIRERVAADWLTDQRKAANERAYERLRSRYEISVAPVPAVKTARDEGAAQ
ncbi:MAG: hypothetical protein AMJ69_12100 [Gammaproteobacteria bacterium SG8_47]|nr:MAG: hypothetical protein AMJ69_12100 [Gammaproteobacteria bacterium SG8_47]